MTCDRGWIDIHAHILPGVDDGAKDWNESLRLLKMCYRRGMRHIIATPHFKRGQDIGKLRDLSMCLNEKAGIISANYHVSLGQEIMYFEGIPEYLEKGLALSLAGSRYVLVEFKPAESFETIKRAVRSLMQASYFPVIAHAERYRCLSQKGMAKELVECGAYLQVNTGSLSGRWLDERTRWCKRELQNGVIHFLATDMHNTTNRSPEIRNAAVWLKRHMGGETAIRIIQKNPQYILSDRML